MATENDNATKNLAPVTKVDHDYVNGQISTFRRVTNYIIFPFCLLMFTIIYVMTFGFTVNIEYMLVLLIMNLFFIILGNIGISVWAASIRKQLRNPNKMIITGKVTSKTDRVVDNVEGNFIFIGNEKFDISLHAGKDLIHAGDVASLHYLLKKNGSCGMLVQLEKNIHL